MKKEKSLRAFYLRGYCGALEIYLLWVNNDYRKQVIGTRLLQKTAEIAIENGALLSLTDTLSFHAPEFYLKNGYEVFGELDKLPQGKKRFISRKNREGKNKKAYGDLCALRAFAVKKQSRSQEKNAPTIYSSGRSQIPALKLIYLLYRY